MIGLEIGGANGVKLTFDSVFELYRPGGITRAVLANSLDPPLSPKPKVPNPKPKVLTRSPKS